MPERDDPGPPGMPGPEGLPGAPLGSELSDELRRRLPTPEALPRVEVPLEVRLSARARERAWLRRPDAFSHQMAMTYVYTPLAEQAEKWQQHLDLPPEIQARREATGAFETRLRTAEEKQAYAEALSESAEEILAIARLLESWGQHEKFSGTIEGITELFTAPWAVFPRAGEYGTIGRMPETLPGKERMGKMVDRALRTWVDMAEGRVTDPSPRSQLRENDKMPNPFGSSIYSDMQEKQIEYVANQVGDRDAAILALRLAEHWNINLRYGVSGGSVNPDSFMAKMLREVGRVEGNNFLLDEQIELAQRRGEVQTVRNGSGDETKRLATIALNVSDSTSDMVKAMYISLRQLSESSKDNPFAVAAPATLGCFPTMVGTALDVFQAEGRRGDKVTFWELWRNQGIELGNLPWSQAEWEFRRRDGEFKGWYEGVGRGARHIPYALQLWYSAGKVYDAIMDTDFKKAGEKIVNPQELLRLNKPFTNGLRAMLDGVALSRGVKLKGETLTKLVQLTKVNWLAGIAVANTSYQSTRMDDPVEFLKFPKIDIGSLNQRVNRGTTDTIYTKSILEAARQVGFLSSVESMKQRGVRIGGKPLYDAERELFEGILNNKRRIGFKPSASGWFDSSEINDLNKAALFAPFKA